MTTIRHHRITTQSMDTTTITIILTFIINAFTSIFFHYTRHFCLQKSTNCFHPHIPHHLHHNRLIKSYSDLPNHWDLCQSDLTMIITDAIVNQFDE